MYAYRFCLLFLYFYNFNKTFGSGEQQPTNTVVTYELKKLEEHGHTTPTKHDHGVKHFVFDPTGHKTVNNVVYDGTSLWTQQTQDGKTFKKLEAYEKFNLLQLVHLQLQKDGTVEDLYYKKNKKEFEKLEDLSKYNELKDKLLKLKNEYVDEFFPLDLHKKDLYTRFYNEKLELFDGVLKRTLTPVNGKAYLARDETLELWNLSTENKQLYNVKEFDFGDDKFLELSLHGGEKKYFSKLTPATTWTVFETSGFDTKVSQLKSRFFTTPLEYDLAVKPDLTNYVLQLKSDVGNSNDLTLAPVRNYYVNKVKFNNQELWSSENNQTRVFRLKLFLLGYEVRMVQLHVAKNPSTVEFTPAEVLYFRKDNGVFNKLGNKRDYEEALKKVKAAADRTKPFVYRNDWLSKDARLDLVKFNPAEWRLDKLTVENGNGLVKVTMTPNEGLTFTSVSYLGQTVLPNDRRPYVDTLVKMVNVLYKKGLLQLVHVNGTRTVTKQQNTKETETFNLYLKKEKDDLVGLDQTQFYKYVELLKQADYFLDKDVHLDLGDEHLNTNFFTVTTETVDGEVKKVVKARVVKVTKLTHNNFEFWKQTQQYKDKHVTHYELHTVGDSKMLTVHFNTVASQVLSRMHFEKRDSNTEWAELVNRTFNAALNAYKQVATWESVELDVSTKPLTNLFNVTVNPLRGNKTELVLQPVANKRLVNVKFGQTSLWFSDQFGRALKVHLYLELYQPMFVVVQFVSEMHGVETTNLKKMLKDAETGNFATHVDFDKKLDAFKVEDNGFLFTYNSDWQLPLSDFDPASFNAGYYDVTTTVEGVLQVKKYVPKPGVLVKKVTFNGAKVWPLIDEDNTTRKLVYLQVFLKDNLVQLLNLHNNLLEGETTPEDLYYKKVKDVYEKVELVKFTELKTSLTAPDKYVDDNVSLDLSTTVSTELFKTESTLEDGLEKEVMELKHGRLYEVKASPALWTSTDGSYVTKLEKYTLDNSQLLVLYVTNKNGEVNKEYFEKSLTPPPASPPEAPAPPVEQQQQESQVPGESAGRGQQEQQRTEGADGQTTESRPSAPAKPSFQSLGDKSAFFGKLNKAKEALAHTEMTLNLNAYKDVNKLRVLESDHNSSKLYKVFPLPAYWVTQLNNGETKVWGKEADGERMVEAWVYLHDAKVKFVYGLVWPKDRQDETKDKQLYYQLNLDTNTYVVKTKEEFHTALEEVTKVVPEPLPVSTGGMLPTRPREFRKLFLTENVDPLLFESRKETRGDYTLRTVNAKVDVFVNLLETDHGVMWKAEQLTHLWKNATFALKNNVGHADLTLLENSVEKHQYYKFENDLWMAVKKEEYDTLNAKVPAAVPVSNPNPNQT